MSANGYLQLAFYVVVLLALAKPLGAYMADVYEGKGLAIRIGGGVERLFYRAGGVDSESEMRWTEYAIAMLVFNLLGGLAVYGLQRLQGMLPLNPQAFGAVSPDSSFNTAVSFMTNTNWQGYGGESTMSYLTQMAALTVQNFLSAATGMAIVVALIRGFARQKATTVGNFWVDMTRSTLYILLPLAFVLALVLVSQGVVQTFSAYKTVPLVQSVEYDNPKLDAAGQPVKDDEGRSGRREGDPEGAGARSGPGGVADRDQAARHQWRGLLQRQLGAPVRESDAAVQLPRNAARSCSFRRRSATRSAGWSATPARAGRCSPR